MDPLAAASEPEDPAPDVPKALVLPEAWVPAPVAPDDPGAAPLLPTDALLDVALLPATAALAPVADPLAPVVDAAAAACAVDPPLAVVPPQPVMATAIATHPTVRPGRSVM